MVSVRSIIARFRTNFLGHIPPPAEANVLALAQTGDLVSPEEERLLQLARRGVREGWVGHATGLGRSNYDIPGLHEKLISDLDSDDPKRQRSAVNNPALQNYLLNEERRVEDLQSMYYFREKFGSVDDLTFARAYSALQEDSQKYVKGDRERLVTDTAEGALLRAETFPSQDDDLVRLGLARFCRAFIQCLEIAMREYDPRGLRDDKFTGKLLRQMSLSHAQESDEDFERSMASYERIARCTEPPQIAHYLEMFLQPDWKDIFLSEQHYLRTQQAAIHTERQREAELIAAEKRRQADKQAKFWLVNDCLDVSVYGWPELGDEQDLRRLLANMKTAFAHVGKVRCAGIKYEEKEFVAIRSLASMSAKQLACMKMHLWCDRTGVVKGRVTTDHMISLLNCDGRAEFTMASGTNQRLTTMFRMTYGNIYTADIESQWSGHLDFLQKWIDTEGFHGELARWFVEDRTDNAGWATSR